MFLYLYLSFSVLFGYNVITLSANIYIEEV